MQKVPLQEVTTTQHTQPPNFEGELWLYANGTPVTPATVKALNKRIQEIAMQPREVDKEVIKQEAMQEAKQDAKTCSTLTAATKKTSASLQLVSPLEPPFPLSAVDENAW